MRGRYDHDRACARCHTQVEAIGGCDSHYDDTVGEATFGPYVVTPIIARKKAPDRYSTPRTVVEEYTNPRGTVEQKERHYDAWVMPWYCPKCDATLTDGHTEALRGEREPEPGPVDYSQIPMLVAELAEGMKA